MVRRAASWLAGKALRLVPESLLGRLLPASFRFDPSRLPELPEVPPAATRLLVAPLNYAGQGREWARAASRLPDTVGMNLMVRVQADFRHPADVVVPLGFYAASRRWQRRQLDWVASEFTHLLVEAERQPFGALLDETTALQVRRMLDRGVRVGMVCHGSDIRLPSAHRKRFPSSPFVDDLAPQSSRLERIAVANRRLLDELGLPTFVSTPDLLFDVPYADWLPVCVEVDRWTGGAIPLTRSRPVVVHAPSSRSVKGSDQVDAAMQRLHDDQVIEYRRVQGVPYEQMPGVYRDADIVLDQFRIADYGVAACEAMAAGRVVVAHVSEHARETVASSTGRELPIVEATLDRLETVVRGLVADHGRAVELAAAGSDFVREVHDGRRSSRVLESFLSS